MLKAKKQQVVDAVAKYKKEVELEGQVQIDITNVDYDALLTDVNNEIELGIDASEVYEILTDLSDSVGLLEYGIKEVDFNPDL